MLVLSTHPLSPSIYQGFFCKDEEDFDDLCARLKNVSPPYPPHPS